MARSEVDTYKLKVLDLFSGIGGFSLGLERTGGFETVAFCEIEPFCYKVLHKHWPDVPIYLDVRNVEHNGLIDVITGGFPCQPFSTASHGVITAIDFWPDMFLLVEKYNPKLVIAENVSEKAINKAAKDLEETGYVCERKRVSAADCGAPHRRNRWWLIAHTHTNGQLHRAINAEAQKLPELCAGLWKWENYSQSIRVPNGVSGRLDRNRVKALGNSVLPQIPEMIGNAILAAIQEKAA